MQKQRNKRQNEKKTNQTKIQETTKCKNYVGKTRD